MMRDCQQCGCAKRLDSTEPAGKTMPLKGGAAVGKATGMNLTSQSQGLARGQVRRTTPLSTIPWDRARRSRRLTQRFLHARVSLESCGAPTRLCVRGRRAERMASPNCRRSGRLAEAKIAQPLWARSTGSCPEELPLTHVVLRKATRTREPILVVERPCARPTRRRRGRSCLLLCSCRCSHRSWGQSPTW